MVNYGQHRPEASRIWLVDIIIECWAGVGVTNLLALLTLLGLLGALLLLRLALLEKGLWDEDLVLGWDAPGGQC